MRFFRQWWRFGGAAGIAFIVLFIVGVILQEAPPFFDDPIDEIREDWVNDGQQYLIAGYILSLAYVFFYFPFISALYGLLSRAEGGVHLWSRVAFVGALIFVLWSAWSSIFWGALAFGDFAETASDETLRTLMVLDYYAVSGAPFTVVVFVGAASIVIATTGVLRRWLVVVGVIVVVLSALAPLAILSTSSESVFDVVYLIAFLILPLWILLVSILMLLKRDEPAPAAP